MKDSTVKYDPPIQEDLYDLPETPLILRQAEVMGKDIPSDPYLYAIEQMYREARRSGEHALIVAAENLYTPIEDAIEEFVPWHSDPIAVAFDIVQAGWQRFRIEAEETISQIREDARREGTL